MFSYLIHNSSLARSVLLLPPLHSCRNRPLVQIETRQCISRALLLPTQFKWEMLCPGLWRCADTERIVLVEGVVRKEC